MHSDPFQQRNFTHAGRTLPIIECGEGPALIVMHELRGPTPAFLDFINKIAAAGFHVVSPIFFGSPGNSPGTVGTLFNIARICISKEFAALHAGQSGPISDWLRALARDLQSRSGGLPVGVLGMCFAGNFALASLVEPAVMAAVMSQPSLPMGSAPEKRADIHLCPNDLQAIKNRVAEERIPLLAMRFTHDKLCPGERMQSLKKEFGDALECIEIDSGPGNLHNLPLKAHSVLTRDLVDQQGHPTLEAYQQVIAYFRSRLMPAPQQS